MTAQIVDIAAARERFGSRIAARREEPGAALEESRRRWLADLETWPRAVRDVVRPLLLSSMPLPDVVVGPYADAWVAEQLSDPSALRRHVEWGDVSHVSSARQGRIPASRLLELVRDCARGEGERARRALLWALWAHGVRKIDREALQAEARTAFERVLEDISSEVLHGRILLERMREAFAQGVVVSGKRMGQPLTANGVKTAPLHIAKREARLAEAEAQLAVLVPWARAYPLAFRLGRLPKRAEQLWPPRHRPKDR